MPKKWAGENLKSAVAKAKKNEAKRAQQELEVKRREDEYWQESDKNVLRKMERQEEKERKKVEEKQRKEASRSQLAKEMEELSVKGAQSNKPAKVTSAQVAAIRKQMVDEEQASRALQANSVVVNDLPLENVNRLVVEGEQARSVQAAINILTNQPADLHPERRAKNAFKIFEERRLPILKAQHSNLRLSQINQLIKKEWRTSEDNPLNQRS